MLALFSKCLPNCYFILAIAIKESANIGQSGMRIFKGVDDLDFYIGDEAVEATGYACKVSVILYACWIGDKSALLLKKYDIVVSNPSRYCWRLGFNGTFLGAMHIQIFKGGTRRSLFFTGKLVIFYLLILKR